MLTSERKLLIGKHHRIVDVVRNKASVVGSAREFNLCRELLVGLGNKLQSELLRGRGVLGFFSIAEQKFADAIASQGTAKRSAI